MEPPDRHQKQQHDGSADGGDSFEFGKDILKDEWSLGDDDDEEEEEDLKAMVEAIRDRAQLSAPSSAHRQLSMLDFLRSFLFQRDMTGTLECFETEWAEQGQTGEVDPKWVDPVPEVYTENQRLAGELKNAEREKEEYRRAASAVAGALERVRRARDAHRLQHLRVVQDKNRLIEEIKRLKAQCDSCQSAVKRMSEKYQAVSKQVLQAVKQQGDNQAARQDVPLSQTVNESNAH